MTRTLTHYPPLPRCLDRQADESIPDYQARCLKFLLVTSCTATMDDEQLRQAEVAGQRACSQTQDQTVLTVVSAARHTIAQVLRWRADQTTIAEVVIPNIAESPTKGGSGVPRVPVAPRYPPAGGMAVLAPEQRKVVGDAIAF